jgi:hypothetical protein
MESKLSGISPTLDPYADGLLVPLPTVAMKMWSIGTRVKPEKPAEARP